MRGNVVVRVSDDTSSNFFVNITSLNAKSRLRKRQPSVFLPDLWNQLPLSLRSLESVTDFKAQLKTRLFVEAFGKD